MIKFVWKQNKVNKIMGLLLVTFVICLLVGSIGITKMVADTKEYYSFDGSLSYDGDDSWKDMIRPAAYYDENLSLEIYSGDTLIKTESMQSLAIDEEYHLSFAHDGYGGGGFVVSNIPKIVDEQEVTKVRLISKNVDFYSDASTGDICFSDDNPSVVNVEIKLQPKMIPLQICEAVEGEKDEVLSTFAVNIKGVNTNNTSNVGATSKIVTVDVTKGETGRTIQVPEGLQYSVSQEARDDYAITGYKLSYITTDSSNSEKETYLEQNVMNLSAFNAISNRGGECVSRYKVYINNAAKNIEMKWNVKWLDNHSANRPDASFKLQYSVDGVNYIYITEDKLDYLGMDAMPTYTEVENITSEDIVTYKYEYLSNIARDGKAISYKVVQMTSSDDYMFDYNSEENTYYNTLKTNFNATIKWLDADVDLGRIRPRPYQIKNNLRLYRIETTTYEEVKLSSSDIIIQQTGANNSIWEVKIYKDLEQYSLDNNKYTYALVEGSMNEDGQVSSLGQIKKDDYTGEEYYTISYYNVGTTDVKQDRCYAEQTIIHTLKNKFNYTMTKVWKDDEDAIRPETTVTLWRYPMENASDTDIDLSQSARVVAQDEDENDVLLQYKLKTTGRVSDLTVSDKYTEVIAFNRSNIPELPSNYKLPMYDATGKKYIYFVVETTASGSKNMYYETKYYDVNGRVNDVGALEGGQIVSVRAGRTSLEINKLWNAASAAADVNGAEVSFNILAKKTGESTYTKIPVLAGSTTISGFGESKLRDYTEVLINPYNDDGIMYEDIIVQENKLSINGSNVPIAYDSENKDTWYFTLGSNEYEGKCGRLTPRGNSMQYDVKSYAVNVTNTIITPKKYSIEINWSEDIAPEERGGQIVTLTGKSIMYVEPGQQPPTVKYTIQVNADAEEGEDGVYRGTAVIINEEGQQEIISYTQIEEDGHATWIIDELPWLKMYDDEGYLIEYSITDVANVDSASDDKFSTAFSGNADGGTITNLHDDTNSLLIYGNKIWNDGGDISSRYTTRLIITDPLKPSISATVDIEAHKFWTSFLKVGGTYFESIVDEENGLEKLDVKEVLVKKGANGAETIYEPYMVGDKTYITTDLATFEVNYDLRTLMPKRALEVNVSNTLVDTVELVIKNIWKDGQNQSGIRPERVTYTVNQYDIYGNKTDAFEYTLTEGDATQGSGGSEWSINVTGLPKYDEYGRRYDYYIDGEPVYDTTVTTTDYKQSIVYDFEFGESVPDDPDYKYDPNGTSKRNDTITYTCSNVLQAETSFTIYQKWLDEAIESEERPDMYMTVYQRNTRPGGGQVSGPDAPLESSYKNQVWTAGGSSAAYTWAIEFLYLDKYDSEGYLYEYYIREAISDVEETGLKYSIEYRDNAVDGPIIDGRYAEAGDYIINKLQDTVIINGEKIWKNIAGFSATDLPTVHIDLYRINPDDTELITSDNTETYMNTVTLVNGATAFTFDKQKIDEGSGNITEIDLQKYDELGRAYTYYLKEQKETIVAPGDCTEGSTADEYNLYNISHVNNTIINEFNTTTNSRSIVMTKIWDRSDVDKLVNGVDSSEDNPEDVYPTVVLNLYRYIGTTNDVSNMEFVRSVTIESDEFEAATNGEVEVTFDNLLIYSPNGSRYKYFVQEEAISGAYRTEYIVDGAATDITAEANGINFSNVVRMNDADKVSRATVKNTYDAGWGNKVKGTKMWNDYKNFYQLRPNSVNLKLRRMATASDPHNIIPEITIPIFEKSAEDPAETEQPYIVWDKNVASGGYDTWQFTIYNLPKYAPNGRTYQYYVYEDDPEAEKYYKNSGRVTNNMSNANSEGILRIGNIINSFTETHTIKKHWIDGNNEYNFRPKSVTMELEVSADGATWYKMYEQVVGSTNIMTLQLTNRHVVANTRGNTWRGSFSNLPSHQIFSVVDEEKTALVADLKDAESVLNDKKDAYTQAEQAFNDAKDAIQGNVNNVNAKQAALDEARANESTALRELNEAKADEEAKKSAYETAVARYNDLQTLYNEYQVKQTEYNNAQSILDTSQEVLDQREALLNVAQTELTDAQNHVDSFNPSDPSYDESEYQAAIQARDVAQTNVSAAQNAVTVAQNDVNTAQAARDSAKSAFDALDSNIPTDYQNAQDDMNTKLTEYQASQATTSQKQAAYNTCSGLVLSKQGDLNNAQFALDQNKETVSYDEKEAAFNTAKTERDDAQTNYDNAMQAVTDAGITTIPTDGKVYKVEPVPVQYRFVETKVGNTTVPESKQVGAYVVSEPTVKSDTTEIRNSLQSTKISLTKKWDDVDNYYQTRFSTTHYKLQCIAQSEVDYYIDNGLDLSDPALESKWEQVCDVDGKPTILQLTSRNAIRDNNRKYNWWRNVFYNLPLSREGDTAAGEPAVVQLYYRVVECTDNESNPQLVDVVEASDGTYTIEPTKTYEHYRDITDYGNAWSYDTNQKTNFMNITNHMITKEDVNQEEGTDLVSEVAAEKRWAKDNNVNGYDVNIELKRAIGSSTIYNSFASPIRKTIYYNGAGVSWDHMPAYDEDGNDVFYKAYEVTTDYRFRVHTALTTSTIPTGTRDLYTFTNIQLLNYNVYTTWENNDRTLPTSETYFSSTFRYEKRITADGDWETIKKADGTDYTDTLQTTYRTQYRRGVTTQSLDKYTVDGDRIYYRAIETHINGVEAANNKAYVSTNEDAELNEDVYTDNDSTEIYHVLRTESLHLTKIWDDDTDYDGVRPAINDKTNMHITLYADYGSGYTVVPENFYDLTWVQQADEGVWKATVSNLPKYNKTGDTLITYKIEESTIPDRYFISKDASVPTFEDGVDDYNYEITNTLTLLLRLRKYDGVNNKNLQGTQFELYKYNTASNTYKKVGSTLTAGVNGYIGFEIKQPGYYRLKETKAVRGYEYLLDTSGEPDLVNGLPFSCEFAVADNNLRQTIIINDSNSVEQVGPGAMPDADAPQNGATKQGVTFNINEGWFELVTQTGLINKRKLGELTFSKRDEHTAKKLDGIVFELYRYENEDGSGNKQYVANIESGKSYICSTTGALQITELGQSSDTGQVNISKLPWGKYKMVEISTLTGYRLPHSTWSFWVGADTVNDATGINENIVLKYSNNTCKDNVALNEKTKFKFYKRGYNNCYLTGGEFKIVTNDKSRTEMSFWKNVYSDDEDDKETDLEPNDYVYGLPVGNYRIVETKAPYGYKPAEDVEFTIDDYGYIIYSDGSSSWKEVNMYDEPVSVDLINVDEDFITPIDGSTFEITGKFANDTGSDITDTMTKTFKISQKKWPFRGELLPSIGKGNAYGNDDKGKYVYKLEQIAVPLGYELQPQVVYFIVNENYQIELTDKNGKKPKKDLQEIYDLFLKVNNDASVPSIIFENLRIPVNDIYILNGETYLDPASGDILKLFYAYDHVDNQTKLGEPIKFWVDKSNLGLLEFAVTTSRVATNKSAYVDSKYVRIYDSKGNKIEAIGNMYNLKEDEIYTLSFTSEYLNGIKTGSRMLYLYSHMPRIDDIEGVYVVRRTAFAEH